MTHRRAVSAALLAVASAAAAFIATPIAAAADGPPRVCDVTAQAFPRLCGFALAPGQAFGLRARGMAPGEAVVFTSGEQTSTVVSDATGTAQTPSDQFVLPGDMTATSWDVSARGQSSEGAALYSVPVPAAELDAQGSDAPGAPLELDGSGFPAGSAATVRTDAGTLVASTTVSPTGAVVVDTTLPTDDTAITYTLSAGGRSAAVTVRVPAAAGLDITPSVVRPGGQISFSLDHFQAGEQVDLHIDNPALGFSTVSDVPIGPQGSGGFWTTVGAYTPVCPGSSTVTGVGRISGRRATASFTILPGDTLSGLGSCGVDAGSALTSANGRFHLAVQTDGNLVLYDGGRPVWATGTRGPYARLVAQADGNLVLYAGGRAVWATGTRGGQPSLVLGDDGSLLLGYGTPGYWTLWGTPPVQPPGDIGTRLQAGEIPVEGYLQSPNGAYRLVHQFDGNVVLYDARGTAVWSVPHHAPFTRFLMQPDGNVVLYENYQPLFATGVGGAGNVLVVQDDGNLVVYSAAGRALWAIR